MSLADEILAVDPGGLARIDPVAHVARADAVACRGKNNAKESSSQTISNEADGEDNDGGLGRSTARADQPATPLGAYLASLGIDDGQHRAPSRERILLHALVGDAAGESCVELDVAGPPSDNVLDGAVQGVRAVIDETFGSRSDKVLPTPRQIPSEPSATPQAVATLMVAVGVALAAGLRGCGLSLSATVATTIAVVTMVFGRMLVDALSRQSSMCAHTMLGCSLRVLLGEHGRIVAAARRGLRAIKERELLARGYRLPSEGMPPVSRMEAQDGKRRRRALVPLRAALATGLTAAAAAWDALLAPWLATHAKLVIPPPPVELAEPTSLLALKFKLARLVAAAELLQRRSSAAAKAVVVAGVAEEAVRATAAAKAMAAARLELELAVERESEAAAAAAASAAANALRPPQIVHRSPAERYVRAMATLRATLEHVARAAGDAASHGEALGGDVGTVTPSTLAECEAQFAAVESGVAAMQAVELASARIELARALGVHAPETGTVHDASEGSGEQGDAETYGEIDGEGLAGKATSLAADLLSMQHRVKTEPIPTLEAYTGPEPPLAPVSLPRMSRGLSLLDALSDGPLPVAFARRRKGDASSSQAKAIKAAPRRCRTSRRGSCPS
ncbi:uncharacterized protein AMSG_09733 [Thecamonas trahens ATCC 50062]|uniref:Myosin-binding domain-containing protein n=1 Tax=Thecamonas trahens ATCC 50062 TaxID=461836 RepID=A0A0L0DRM2_THETB|nr:hypothetical protein AMSG_09733 [Thecamonas trahens ATCC 50062]KNC54068.1 hypothetical protein AMSG_09733 [Thecamonas trahens ATCC 50062]|eukprot:XP_013754077.1 hypothetical protein AMSG_09733 [Thecamonas trahens ATCC 50062]